MCSRSRVFEHCCHSNYFDLMPPLLHCDMFLLASMGRSTSVASSWHSSSVVSKEMGKDPGSALRRYLPWQRMPATIEVVLLGWDVFWLTPWLVRKSSKLTFYVESVCFFTYISAWVCLSGRSVLFSSRVSWCGRDALWTGDQDNKGFNRTAAFAGG